MYDTTITLISETIKHDSIGNEKKVTSEQEVFAVPRSVYASEFYQAASVGLKPSVTFILTNREDYNGQKTIEWQGRKYSVIRADWTAQRDTLNLICEEKVGV